MKLIKFILPAVLTLAGCSNVTKIGSIGDCNFYKVHVEELDGPNITSLLVQGPNGKLTFVQTYGGPGVTTTIAPAAVSAGGDIVASKEFGHSLEPSHTNVNVSGTGNSNSSSTAKGGQAINGNQNDQAETVNGNQ